MTHREKIDAYVDSTGDPVYVADGLDEALIGMADVFCGHSHSMRAVYSVELVVGILTKRDGMGDGEARDFFEFNIQGSIMDRAPIYVRTA